MTKITITLADVKDAIAFWMNSEILQAEKEVDSVEYVPAGKEFIVNIKGIEDDIQVETESAE